MDLIVFVPVVAMLLDLAIGDPPGLFHPVRLLGALLEREERVARRLFAGRLKLAGIVLVVMNLVLAGLVTALLVAIPYLGLFFALYLAYAGLALGQLLREAARCRNLLAQGRLAEARTRIGSLVSRDLSQADEPALRRALAETVSENANDGFVAPFFWLVLGGPALLWVYKTASTMDSMWGYRNERYAEFGWAAARTDDVMAFLPARITAFAMMGAGWLMRLDWRSAYEHARDQALTCASSNAGWPMATAAWLMGARMGGACVYDGAPVAKPELGPEGDWTGPRLGCLMRMVAVACIGAGLLMNVYFAMVFGG